MSSRRGYFSNYMDRVMCFEDTYTEKGLPDTNFSGSTVGLIVKTRISSGVPHAQTRHTFIQFKSENLQGFKKLVIYQWQSDGYLSGETHVIAVDLVPNVDLRTLTFNNEPAVLMSNIASFVYGNGPYTSGPVRVEVDLESFLSGYSGDTITIKLSDTTSKLGSVVFHSKNSNNGYAPRLIK